jgi:hypothetical protein
MLTHITVYHSGESAKRLYSPLDYLLDQETDVDKKERRKFLSALYVMYQENSVVAGLPLLELSLLVYLMTDSVDCIHSDPSNRLLTEELHMTDLTLKRCIASLEKKKIIAVGKVKHGRGARRIFTILLPFSEDKE